MMNRSVPSCALLPAKLLLVSICWLSSARPLSATDYSLTIGVDYTRSGNQASLDANVFFFKHFLTETHGGPLRHDIYFADGHAPAEVLQLPAEKPADRHPFRSRRSPGTHEK